jgi:trehalose utilization protein
MARRLKRNPNRQKESKMAQRISRRKVLALGAAAAGGLILPRNLLAAAPRRRVLVWSEGTAPKDVYPKDINTVVAEGLKASLKGWDVVIGSLSDPDQGCAPATVKQMDVVIWWGHQKHGQVSDENVSEVVRRVKEEGMGFIALHSSHFCKPLKRVLGTNCGYKAYVADGSALKVIVKEPAHPISKGVKTFEQPHTERYTEPFEVPEPEAVPLDGEYTLPDGQKEKSRQGLCWTAGKGKVFYFQPGHETYPVYQDPNVRLILHNAVLWAAPKK